MKKQILFIISFMVVVSGRQADARQADESAVIDRWVELTEQLRGQPATYRGESDLGECIVDIFRVGENYAISMTGPTDSFGTNTGASAFMFSFRRTPRTTSVKIKELSSERISAFMWTEPGMQFQSTGVGYLELNSERASGLGSVTMGRGSTYFGFEKISEQAQCDNLQRVK